jgi:hypothetical protein
MLFGAYLGAVKKLERAGAAPDAGQQPGSPPMPAAVATASSTHGPSLAEVDLAELQLLRAEQARMQAQYERMAAKLADMEGCAGQCPASRWRQSGRGSSERATRGRHQVAVDTAVSVLVRGKV